MAKAAWKSEADLAKHVIAHLRYMRYEVYQEVQPDRFGPVADIVATRGAETAIIETKLSLSLALLGQAIEWKGRATWIAAACPDVRCTAWSAVRAALQHSGVGLWYVATDGRISERVKPVITRRVGEKTSIRTALREEHKTYAAAGTSGTRFTPFRATENRVVMLAKSEPGLSLKKLVEKIEHHYASNTTACCSLAKWIRDGVISGVELRQVAGEWGVYPKG